MIKRIGIITLYLRVISQILWSFGIEFDEELISHPLPIKWYLRCYLWSCCCWTGGIEMKDLKILNYANKGRNF